MEDLTDVVDQALDVSDLTDAPDPRGGGSGASTSIGLGSEDSWPLGPDAAFESWDPAAS
jgi:hypothetical protein